MASSSKKMIKLKTSDGVDFIIDETVAIQSQTIKNMIESIGDTIHLPNVAGKIFSRVIEYCEKHVETSSEDELKSWDGDFMKVDLAVLSDLLLAANNLKIDRLVDLACKTTADFIKDKTPEELRQIFNIENPFFAPEEKEQIRRENERSGLGKTRVLRIWENQFGVFLQAYQRQEREAAQFAEKECSYKLLDADDEDDDNSLTSITQQGKGTSKKRLRKKGASRESEDDDKEPAIKRIERNVRSRKSEGKEDDIESEEAIMHDQEERAQLERNMKERDAARTRQLTEPKLSKKDKEEMIRRSKALKKNDTSDLRKVSRRAYLQKRRDHKLLEIRDDIIDHEYIFEGVKLTEAQEREMRYKKKIYKLAKEHLEEVDEYRMPEAYDQDGGVNQEKRFAAAMQHYRDPGVGDKMNPFAEQEAWEEHQIGKASLKFGSKDRKR